MRRRHVLAALLILAGSPAAAQAPRGPLVLAAASLKDALDAAADAWARRGHPRPVVSYAASSVLARQVLAGAQADLFASADEDWMDALAKANRIVPASRADIAGNLLVVVAPAANPIRLTRATLARTLARGAVAMADPASVPAGRYGRAALTALGAWPQVAPKVVRAENVRAALALIERGAAPYGIVYATDARASRAVRVAGVFPASSHPPIRYPVARLVGAGAQGEGFRRFLLSREGAAILTRYGFTRP